MKIMIVENLKTIITYVQAYNEIKWLVSMECNVICICEWILYIYMYVYWWREKREEEEIKGQGKREGVVDFECCLQYLITN